MRKEVIQTGKTVDMAIDAACAELGCERDKCDWEILELPRKGFLGLKQYPAKVRVSIEEEPVVVKQAPAAKGDEEQKNKKESSAAPKKAASVKSAKEQHRNFKALPKDQNAKEITEDFTEKEELALDYLKSILKEMKLEPEIKLLRYSDGICLKFTGSGLGAIIGRRGETLDAIQSLVSLVANRGGGDYTHITVDCGNYREKRQETLEALAKKLANQVLKTNISQSLEPMNPFERRIIHAAVSEIEGVYSHSVGEEPNRRVIISSPNARPARGRYNGKRNSAPGRGGRDRRGPRTSSMSSSPAKAIEMSDVPPKKTPEAEASEGQKLYTKIEID